MLLLDLLSPGISRVGLWDKTILTGNEGTSFHLGVDVSLPVGSMGDGSGGILPMDHGLICYKCKGQVDCRTMVPWLLET